MPRLPPTAKHRSVATGPTHYTAHQHQRHTLRCPTLSCDDEDCISTQSSTQRPPNQPTKAPFPAGKGGRQRTVVMQKKPAKPGSTPPKEMRCVPISGLPAPHRDPRTVNACTAPETATSRERYHVRQTVQLCRVCGSSVIQARHD